MPEQHQDTGKLDEAEEVLDMDLPASDQTTEIVHPGEQSFYFPSTLVTPERAAILSFAVVLSKGSLPIAMRATMSLPGIFTPVKMEKMVLVDGGVLENIPVDPVRNMGADVVIAVALETNRPNPDQIKFLSDVMRQTVAIAIAKNE